MLVDGCSSCKMFLSKNEIAVETKISLSIRALYMKHLHDKSYCLLFQTFTRCFFPSPAKDHHAKSDEDPNLICECLRQVRGKIDGPCPGKMMYIGPCKGTGHTCCGNIIEKTGGQNVKVIAHIENAEGIRMDAR